MLLRPSNTLLLDEPTNHLDLDSKDVLLEALEDYGGTLIFVSHDRYFVEKLATKIIEIGHGEAIVYPGTYRRIPAGTKAHGQASGPGPSASGTAPKEPARPAPRHAERKTKAESSESHPAQAGPRGADRESREARKQAEPDGARKQRELDSLRKRIADLGDPDRRPRGAGEGNRSRHERRRLLRRSRCRHRRSSTATRP